MAFANEDIVYKGVFACIAEYATADITRPLRYAIDDYGWVNLAGWVQWQAPDQTLVAGNIYTFNSASRPLPAAINTVGIRDFIGCTVYGPMHYRVVDNLIQYRPLSAITLLNGSSWFSFDGCSYRL